MAELVLFDGVCGLCNRSNQFLLKRDTADRLLFAPLQSELARDVLARYGRNASDLDTIYVVADYQGPHERLLDRSRAVFHALSCLGGGYRAARWLGLLPRPLTDAVYRLVARSRYDWFGQSDVCMLPEPRHRRKFIDEVKDT